MVIEKHKKLPLCMSLLFGTLVFYPIQIDATDVKDNIVVSSSTVDMKVNSYNNNLVSSMTENKEELYKSEITAKEELLNEELIINNLDNLIVNYGEDKLYIYEEQDENSDKVGILKPNAIGEAEDIREFESDIDRFIAGEAEWLYIQSGEISGYIKNKNLLHSNDAVKKLNDLYNTKAKVTSTSKVYVRYEADANADAITYLNSGSYVKVNTEKYDKESEWIPVIVDEEEGFVKADLITLINSVDYAEKYFEYTYATGARKVIPPSEETPSAVVDFACQFIGNPYVWGGTSLTNGCDCSGFVMKVYEYFGISLPHYSYSLQNVGIAIDYDNIQPGDIVCYDGHVGIYAGHGQIVNAFNKQNGIILTDVNYDTVLAVRRVLY